MTKESAERAIITSALIVFGIYTYRHLTEGTTTQNQGAAQLLGKGTPPNFGRFLTGWGFVFLSLSIVAEAAPGVGGMAAILVATADALTNAVDVKTQLDKQINTPTTTAKTAAPKQATVQQVNAATNPKVTG